MNGSGHTVFLNSHIHGDILVREAGDATSSAPAYFPATDVRLHADAHGYTQTKVMVDGGVVMNNPMCAAIAVSLKAQPLQQNEVVRALSISTGTAPTHIPRSVGGVDFLKDYAADLISETTANHALAIAMVTNPQVDKYLRINVDLGDADSALNNISAENLRALSEAGHRTFDMYRLQLDAFFGL